MIPKVKYVFFKYNSISFFLSTSQKRVIFLDVDHALLVAPSPAMRVGGMSSLRSQHAPEHKLRQTELHSAPKYMTTPSFTEMCENVSSFACSALFC